MLVRVLRVIRVMKLFQSLNILVHAIISSIPSLVWSMLLLMLIVLMSGLFMCQVVADYITDDQNPLDTRNWVYDHYGGASRATLTMFEATMSGCWPNYSRRLIEEVSVWYAVFFVLYIAGVVFAVTRIISAIFLRETLQVASQEADILLAEDKRQREGLMFKLADFFKEADQSGDGMMDRSEFERMLVDPNVRLWFRGLDLHVHEYVSLFNLMDNGNGYISLEDFLDGVSRLKGQARSLDVLGVVLEIKKIRHQLEEIHIALDPAYEKL